MRSFVRIDVNNGCTLELGFHEHKMTISSLEPNKNCLREETIGEGDIVMVCNLLRYMRRGGHKSVYLRDENGVLEEFRIFE